MKKAFTRSFPTLIIFSFALLVRISYNLTVAHGYIPEFDANAYNSLAISLLKEHCFCNSPGQPAVGRAPLWPFLIALVYAVMGIHNLYARLLLCVLGSGTCVLTYLFAKDIFTRRIALVVGIIAALYPGLFIYDGWLYSESVYTFFVMGFAYALFRLQRAFNPGWIVACSLALVGAMLTRPNGISLLALVFIWAIVMLRTCTLSWRKGVTAVLGITCLTLCLVAPWTLRNYQQTHRFILVAQGGGLVLAGAYNDAALTSTRYGFPGMWMSSSQIQPPLTDHSDGGETTYAVHWIRTHLVEMPQLLAFHFINLWRPYTSEEGLPVREFPARLSSRILWHLMNTMPLAIILLAFCGLLATARTKWKELLVPYLIIGLTIVLGVVFYGSSRFRAPIEPLLVLLAGGFIWWLTSSEPGTLHAWRHSNGDA